MADRPNGGKDGSRRSERSSEEEREMNVDVTEEFFRLQSGFFGDLERPGDRWIGACLPS